MSAKNEACIGVTELAATVQDLRITMEVMRDLFNIGIRESSNPDAAASVFTAVERYWDDADLCRERLEACVNVAKVSASGADPLDQWIKVTPKTLPKHEQPVLAWSEALGRSEPAFYDHKLKCWCRLFDNGSTLLEGNIPYYRIGSEPPVAKGGSNG